MEFVNVNEVKSGNKSRLNNIILKEDLERYYINEKKSMAEISRIYKCSVIAVKRRLKKYGITIRPKGAFLVDDDGESLRSKYNKGNICGGDYKNALYKEAGFENSVDYSNNRVKKKGYRDINDYNRKMSHERGIGTGLSMSENKSCPKYLGVYICENKEFISKIIDIIESMKCNNPGYDVVCGKGKKIDIKCSCLNSVKQWSFCINKNKTADYFLMIAFDDRKNLNVMHIWLVKGDSVIEKTIKSSKEFVVNEKIGISISKGNRALKRWIKYEITDTYKLEEVQKVCNNFNNNK